MKTQLNSHINVASDSFDLTGHITEMNEAVTHRKVNMCQQRSFSEVLGNCLSYTFTVEIFASDFFKHTCIYAFSCTYVQIESRLQNLTLYKKNSNWLVLPTHQISNIRDKK